MASARSPRRPAGVGAGAPLALVFARVLHRAAAADRDGQLLGLQRVRDHPRLHRAQLRGGLRGLRRRLFSARPSCAPRSRPISRRCSICITVWLITLVLGFTIAYFLAFHVRSLTMQIVLFLICTIPFWTSNVIRMISWIPLLGRNGLVNQALVGTGLVHQPLEWLLFSDFAVILALRAPLHALHDRADLQLDDAHRPLAARGRHDAGAIRLADAAPTSSSRWPSPASSSARSSSSPSSWATSSPSA